MARQKTKANWMILLLFLGSIFYAINFVKAVMAPDHTVFDFIGIDMNKWVYLVFTLIASIGLLYISNQWYKQKRSAK